MEKEFEALEFGKWYPIEEYYKRSDKLDWALVQFKETKTGFMPLPYKAEYIKRDGVWTTQSEQDRYLCELCEPVAFMLWQPYEQALTELKAIKEAKPSEALNKLYIIGHLEIGFDKDGKPITVKDGSGYSIIKQYILKTQEQEKVLNNIHNIISKYMFELVTFSNKEELKTNTINAIIKEVE